MNTQSEHLHQKRQKKVRNGGIDMERRNSFTSNGRSPLEVDVDANVSTERRRCQPSSVKSANAGGSVQPNRKNTQTSTIKRNSQRTSTSHTESRGRPSKRADSNDQRDGIQSHSSKSTSATKKLRSNDQLVATKKRSKSRSGTSSRSMNKGILRVHVNNTEEKAPPCIDSSSTTESSAESASPVVDFDCDAALKRLSEEMLSQFDDLPPSQKKSLNVSFGGSQVMTYISDKHKPHTKWYAKEDLVMLLNHEISICRRLDNSNQKGSKAKTLHCCWRGLEHIQFGYSTSDRNKEHVQTVLASHCKLRDNRPEDDAANLLRVISRSDSKMDRKMARRLALNDAWGVSQQVIKEHTQVLHRQVDAAPHVRDSVTAACVLVNYAARGTVAEKSVHDAVSVIKNTYGTTVAAFSKARSAEFFESTFDTSMAAFVKARSTECLESAYGITQAETFVKANSLEFSGRNPTPRRVSSITSLIAIPRSSLRSQQGNPTRGRQTTQALI